MRSGDVGALAVVTALAVGCASEGFPPGGPEDNEPPAMIDSDPAFRAVNAGPDQAIVLTFDEVIDPNLENRIDELVRVNPDDPEFEVELDEDTVTLTPLAPMRDGVTYTVLLLPGLADRAGNATEETRAIPFSVGGEAPITLSFVRATIVEDTLPAAGALYRIENLDEELGYLMEADSTGFVEMEAVAYGRYVATAWRERVRPEGWQETEEPGARDTFDLTLEDRLHEATYRIAVVDTTAPLVTRIEVSDARTIVVALDDAIPSETVVAPEQVRLWEAAAGVDPGTPADSVAIERQRGARLEVERVDRIRPSELRVTTWKPLARGRLHRIELDEVANASGLVTTPEGGRAFRADYEGPPTWPADSLPWPFDEEAVVSPEEEPPPEGEAEP